MTLDEIKCAVESGETVHWHHEDYVVIKDMAQQSDPARFIVVCLSNQYTVGLTYKDGTFPYDGNDFFLGEKPHSGHSWITKIRVTKIITHSGHSWITKINGTEHEIVRYYLGRSVVAPYPGEKIETVIACEIDGIEYRLRQ